MCRGEASWEEEVGAEVQNDAGWGHTCPRGRRTDLSKIPSACFACYPDESFKNTNFRILRDNPDNMVTS